MYVLLGASHSLRPGDISYDIMDRFDYFAFTAFILSTEKQIEFTYEMVEAARSLGKGIITLLSNTWCIRTNGDRLRQLADISDYVSDNVEEFSMLYSIEDPENLIKTLATRTAGEKPTNKAIIMTMGGEGALVFYHGKKYYVPPSGVNVVDTTGAGDVFAGGLLYGILNGWSVRKAGEFAVAVVGDLISHFGTYMKPETRAKINQIKASA